MDQAQPVCQRAAHFHRVRRQPRDKAFCVVQRGGKAQCKLRHGHPFREPRAAITLMLMRRGGL